MVGRFHIGTSGWSYKDWIGIFYPRDLPSAGWLSYYSKIFDCTEINSSFYRLPQKQTVINWADQVPRKFLFCPKMSRFLTHMKKLREPEEPLERFFSIFAPLGNKMGPVLIQLPKIVSFNHTVTEHLFKLLKEKYSSYDFALEVRHGSWMTETSYALMAKYNIAFVISHSGNHFPYAEVVTSKNIYFRFHGPGTLYNTKYHHATIRKYSRLFKTWLDAGHDLWIFFNNDWFGYGIDDALRLKKILNKLNGGFLLTKAMKASEPPDDFCRINTHHLSPGKTLLYNIKDFIILATPVCWNYDRSVGNIKICIRSGQSLVLVKNFIRHRQFNNI